MNNKPILLTGAHRSGTTWLANMLTLGGGMQIASEPFNLDTWAYKFDGLAKYWFTYAPELDQTAAVSAFKKVIDCRTRKVFGRRMIQRYFPPSRTGRVLIKDPIACMSSEWLSQHFDLAVLVLVRHPAAFAASLKRMQWYFPFDHLVAQEQLMEEMLEPFKQDILKRPENIIEQAALIWNIIYHVLGVYIERHPEWLLVKHEALSREPVTELHGLYDRLSLNWSGSVEQNIREATGEANKLDIKEGVAHQMKRDSKANVFLWKKLLSDEEINLVREKTQQVSGRYYEDQDW